MNWIRVLSESDLVPGTRRVVNIGRQEILLINRRGTIHALAGRCPHMRARLEKGELTEDGAIVCPRHRSVFDLRDGSVREWVPWPPVVGRALGAIAEEHALSVYATKIDDGSIWVNVEEAE